MAFDRSPACSRRRAQPRRAHHRAARTTGYRSCPARRCLRAHKCDPSWKHHAIARNSAQASTEFLGQTRVVRVVKSAVPGSSLRPYMISWSGQICGVAKIVCFGVPRALTRVSTAARDYPPSLLILQAAQVCAQACRRGACMHAQTERGGGCHGGGGIASPGGVPMVVMHHVGSGRAHEGQWAVHERGAGGAPFSLQ